MYDSQTPSLDRARERVAEVTDRIKNTAEEMRTIAAKETISAGDDERLTRLQKSFDKLDAELVAAKAEFGRELMSAADQGLLHRTAGDNTADNSYLDDDPFGEPGSIQKKFRGGNPWDVFGSKWSQLRSGPEEYRASRCPPRKRR